MMSVGRKHVTSVITIMGNALPTFMTHQPVPTSAMAAAISNPVQQHALMTAEMETAFEWLGKNQLRMMAQYPEINHIRVYRDLAGHESLVVTLHSGLQRTPSPLDRLGTIDGFQFRVVRP